MYEPILPESHPNRQATGYDITMILLLSAFERTESMWRALLESAGFQIIKIWGPPPMIMSIIEAEPIGTSSADKVTLDD